MSNVIRVHKGAKFQYTGAISDEVYTVTVTEIAMVIDSKETDTRIYFENDHRPGELFCLNPRNFYESFALVKNYQQIA